jgi:hypothetical protein
VQTRPGAFGEETLAREVQIEWTSIASHLSAFAVKHLPATGVVIKRPVEIAEASPSVTERPKERRQPAREPAETALRELYPNGIPDEEMVPNKTLHSDVAGCLKAKGQRQVSLDSVLRAAGRRRK